MRRTPLYEVHRRLGARLVEFAGWEMPLQYAGILKEHAAVRNRAGLFDVSHMGEIEVRGAGALAACQRVTCNDVGRLTDGSAQYNMLMLPGGGIVDDVVLHRLSGSRYLFCVNAANREQAFDHLRRYARDAEVVDRSDEYAQLAMQGPLATRILGRLTDLPLERIRRFAFREGTVAGVSALVARTGYTGEDGWELYCAASAGPSLWDTLLEEGRDGGLVPCGLGARDTLRLEAALPLYGHELTAETTPLEAGLAWVVRLEKGDFLGCPVLERQQIEGVKRRLVGLVLADGGVPRAGHRIYCGSTLVGAVTSGTRSPTLGKGIALGYVDSSRAGVGTRLAIEIRERLVEAEVSALPFYRRASGRGEAGRN
jgi:aminomethyltransferase